MNSEVEVSDWEGATGEGAEEHFQLSWDVPATWMQVEQDLYRPQPRRESPTTTVIVGGRLSLDWRLDLIQSPAETRVSLRHVTPGIPNLGVRYTVHILRSSGENDRDRLSAFLRSQLAKTTPQDLNPRSGLGRLRPSYFILQRYLHQGDVLKLRVNLSISPQLFRPERVCEELLRPLRAREKPAGSVAKALWAQVLNPLDSKGTETDVVFRCLGNGHVKAHCSVLLLLCPALRSQLASRTPDDRWIIDVAISAPALLEALHYVYHRRVSTDLVSGPLEECLEAGYVLGLDRLYFLEVEKLLTATFRPDDRTPLLHLARRHRLHVLYNLISTAAAFTVATHRTLPRSAHSRRLALPAQTPDPPLIPA